MSLGVMNHDNPRWQEFRDRLEGPEGCNFREKIPGDRETLTWDCKAGRDKTHAIAILTAMGATVSEIVASCEYFTAQGGFCDCEILFNVGTRRLRPTRRRTTRRGLVARRRKNPRPRIVTNMDTGEVTEL